MSRRLMILEHLKSGDTLTRKECYELFGELNLAARIKELRDQGWNIQSLSSGKKYVLYKLVGDESSYPDEG